jgi:tripartite-type tricarboxylate transporter receptor subunit TctC
VIQATKVRQTDVEGDKDMNETRRRILARGAALAGASTLAPAFAQGDGKPIHIVIGYTTGGASDLIMRIVGTKLSSLLNGVPIVYEYKPGAGGAIGNEYLMRAAADGTELSLVDSGPMACLTQLRKLPYDPVKDFTLLSYVGGGPIAVLANASLPANDIPGLVKLLKAQPERYTYATSGIGTTQHFAGEMFKLRAGVNIRHIPYKGAAPALADIMGNQVDLGFSTIGPAVQLVASGKLKVLGVTSSYRSSSFPDVPTIAEQGYPGYDAVLWYAFAGPARMPAAVSQRLQAALRTALSDKDVVAMLQKAGIDDIGAKTPELVARLIEDDVKKWGDVVKRANITMEG